MRCSAPAIRARMRRFVIANYVVQKQLLDPHADADYQHNTMVADGSIADYDPYPARGAGATSNDGLTCEAVHLTEGQVLLSGLQGNTQMVD